MSSVSTAFKVHYNQKLGGGHSAILGGGRTMAFGGDRRPCTVTQQNMQYRTKKHTKYTQINK